MGLDVKAYRNIILVPYEQVKIDKYGDIDYSNVNEVIYAEILEEQNRNFPHRADEFKGGECLKINSEAEDFWHFHRSYGWYNTWRDALYEISEEFYDLWDFPDNEGYLGTETSEKLYQVFKKYEKQGRQMFDKGETYFHFMKAFDLARKKGCVCFG